MAGNQQNPETGGKISEHTHFNPVNVTDTIGVIILGMLSFTLLIALLRAQARNRRLIAQLSGQDH